MTGDFPLLATLQLLPLATMVLLLALHRRSRALFPVALIAALLQLLLAVELYQRLDHATSAFQFAERVALLGPLVYHAAVDGVSVLFVLLTTLLTLLVVIYGQVRPFPPQGLFLAVVFAVQAALLSSVVTVDLLWFVLVTALQLLPVSYLLHRWSTSAAKDEALARFLQFMGSGLLLLFAGTLMLGWQYADAHGGRWSFELQELLRQPVASGWQSVIFFLLFYGLAVRIPLFPLHGWLPKVAEHGSVAVAPVFLIGLKSGIYGMVRFVLPLLPEGVLQWHGYVVAFAVAGVFYAALLALTQVNLRRLLAFAVISHSGILIIGLFSLSHAAFQGTMLLSVNFGLAAAGLLFMTGMVFRRTRTPLLGQLGGLFEAIPLIGITFFLAGLSIVGMPGTPGFDAAHLLLEAAMHRYGALVTIAAALGNVVAAGFLLWAFQRAFLGPRPEGLRELEPVNRAEILLSLIVLGCLLSAGFHSEPWLELVDHSLRPLGELYAQGSDSLEGL
ncbi:MAG: NADH-quinone oxidoreductase subunit M [Gammaproteobacteria bacterium]|nr:NADH-quinone oxidoreductase subunit M [Gammaproteobacteria bacterium]